MPKQILGIDVGGDSLKLALTSGGRVLKTASAPMPDHMLREGSVVSRESMAELIRDTMKENGIRARHAAYVMPNESVFIRSVTMPRMTADQLAYNLPFEFRDYISDEVSGYLFDYAVLGSAEAAEGEEEAMELLAVGAARPVVDDLRDMMIKSGLRLKAAAPAICSHISLLRRLDDGAGREYCLVDLGRRNVRMYMYRGDRHMVTRELEQGLAVLDDALADAYNVDPHLARTYLASDYRGCTREEVCMNTYSSIALDMMRALNFYRFSNPDSTLNDIWLCGGGAELAPLRETIEQTLDVNIHPASELIPGGGDIPECGRFVQAVGITLDP